MFLKTFEALSDDEVDESIDIEIEDDIESMVKCAVDGLWKLIGGEGGLLGNAKPSEEKIREALEHAKEYKARKSNKTFTQPKQAPPEKIKDRAPRYYGLLPDIELETIVNRVFTNVSNGSSNSGVGFWEMLKKAGRVVKQPHVTIVHQKELPQAQDVWDLSQSVAASTSLSGFKVKIGKLLWDEKVMVLTVENIEQAGAKGGNGLMDMLPVATKNRLHITVGTADETIAAVEGMKLVQNWRNGQKEKDGIFESEIGEEIIVAGQLEGLIS